MTSTSFPAFNVGVWRRCASTSGLFAFLCIGRDFAILEHFAACVNISFNNDWVACVAFEGMRLGVNIACIAAFADNVGQAFLPDIEESGKNARPTIRAIRRFAKSYDLLGLRCCSTICEHYFSGALRG
jgi:hypothetical protein